MADEAGRKIFMVNPHSVVKDALVEEILAQEYELYVLKDPDKALQVFLKFPDSVVFVNIDSGKSEAEWADYVRMLRTDKRFSDLSIGILSYNPEPELVEKYLMEIGVQCGFVKLRLGAQESTKIMLKALEANEAKGRRKYIRARTGHGNRAFLNLEYGEQSCTATIVDISSVGMAVQFTNGLEIPPKTVLTQMQLRLKATLVNISGVVLGTRAGDASTHVVLFKQDTDEKARRRIRQFINRSLQEYIDGLVA